MSHVSRPVKAVPHERARGDARRERWREHRQARRAEFVDATVRAIGKHGPEVGMDEIAAEAGVSKPVLYRHFSDKSDLYLAVSQWGTALLMRRIRPTFAESGGIFDRIRRIVDTYLQVIEQYPDLYRFVVRRAFADRPTSSDPVADEKTEIANLLSRFLGEYLRLFGLDSGGAEPWSHGLVGMVQTSGDWWLERQTMSRDDLSDYLARIIWHAIDGVLRSGGVVLDPDTPLDFGPLVQLVPDDQLSDESDAPGPA